jgi:hypothetical protein
LGWVNDEADVRRFLGQMRTAFSIARESVICADWRGALVLPPAASDALLELLRQGNGFFERSAVLLPAEDATFGLQVERLVREAQNRARRTFRAATPLLDWLGEVLTPAERKRAAEFIALGPAQPVPR